MTELTGVLPITATPFDAEGRVDDRGEVAGAGLGPRRPRRS